MRGDKPPTGYNPSMKTTAALLRAARQPFDITTLELAPPGPGEVQVRVKAEKAGAERAGAIPRPFALAAPESSRISPDLGQIRLAPVDNAPILRRAAPDRPFRRFHALPAP